MKFKLPENIARNSLAINKMDLYIHIKKKGRLKGRQSRKSRKGRRITLKIYEFKEDGRTKKRIARLRCRPVRSDYYRVRLPVSNITDIKRFSQRHIHLCISCLKCNRKTSVTFPLKKKQTRSNKRRPKLKLKKNRPYLLIKTKKPLTKRPKRRNQGLQETETIGCRREKFIRFSKIGLGKKIYKPKGFHISVCTPSCSPEVDNPVGNQILDSYVIKRKDVVVKQNNTHMDITLLRQDFVYGCVPTSLESTDLKAVSDSLTKMSIRIHNANFKHCTCNIC